MTAAASRSSAALRAELAQIDTDLSAQDGRLSSCDTQVRVLALLARRGDPAKVKGIAEARSLKVSIACEIDFTSAASGAQCGAGCRARARGDGGAAGEAAREVDPEADRRRRGAAGRRSVVCGSCRSERGHRGHRGRGCGASRQEVPHEEAGVRRGRQPRKRPQDGVLQRLHPPRPSPSRLCRTERPPLPTGRHRPQDSGTDSMLTSEFIIGAVDMAEDAANICRTCGACCSFSAEWPRFSTEDETDLDRIPRALVDSGQGRMRCSGDRCAALVGDVGVSTSCAVYAVRPQVCRACLPGDDACQTARRRFGL